jgi:UDP-GlcNAc:undecaprenyl-phosphate GlcNAc-1-phosphate transferase
MLAVAFSAAIAIPLLATPLVRRLALRFGAVDRKTRRKIHDRDVPRLGGIAIAAGFFVSISILAFFVQAQTNAPSRWLALIGGSLAMLALGIYDDLRGASAAQKLVVQTAVAVVAWAAGLRFGAGHALVIPPLVSLILTVGWVVGVTNAMNLIDGLDGLASGIAMQSLATIALCAWHHREPTLAIAIIVLICAVGGFLRHNFHPAAIFMGDSGSLLLGYVVSVASLWVSQKATTVAGAFFPIVMLGLPLLDTWLAVLRRLSRGQKITAGDLEHIHHRVLAVGRSQTRSVLILYSVGFVFSLLATLSAFDVLPGIPWLPLVVALAVAAAFVGWLRLMKPPRDLDVVAIRRRNLLVRRALVDLEGTLQRCTQEADLEEALRRFHDTVHDEFPSKRAVQAQVQSL